MALQPTSEGTYMTVLFSQITLRNATQISNFQGDSTVPRTQTYVVIEGNGVYRRPNWKRLPKLSRMAPANYLKSWSKLDAGNYYWRFDNHGTSPSDWYWTEKQGPLEGVVASRWDPDVLGDSDYKAKVKLFNQLKGEGANLANMLGERKQVVKSIESILNTIVFAIRDIKRGNLASAIRRFGGDPLSARKLKGKDIADIWLSLQYGWKPLLKDVADILDGAHKRELSTPVVFRASSRTKRSGLSDSSWTLSPVFGKQVGNREADGVVKYMCRVRPDATLAEPAALGFTDPLTVLWEVTPWSFVIDWFLPVGRYLGQLTADHGWYFIDGCRTRFLKNNEHMWSNEKTHADDPPGWRTDIVGAAYASASYVEMERTIINSLPTPSAPRLKNPLSIAHFENALALGYQLVHGKGSKPPR